MFLIGLFWLGIIAWLLWRAIRQFNAYKVIDPSAGSAGTALPHLSVIIPARNESQNIAACVRSLTAQDYPRELLEIIVIDDNSTDRTAAIVQEIAETDPRVRLVFAGDLSAGWIGKSHACWKGVKQAGGEWICFIDADTIAAPSLLSTAVAHATVQQIDMLSLEPRQVLGSFWERLVIPSGLVLVSFIVDLRTINDPTQDGAAADGQFILIRRRVYDDVGGHYAVRAEFSEDTALARLLQSAGYRTFLMGGDDLIRVRMYSDFSSLWNGLARTAVDVAGGSRKTFFASIGALLLGWLAVILPVWMGTHLTPEWNTAAWGFTAAVLGSLALLGTNIGQTVYFRIPFWYGLIFPLGYTAVATIALRGIWGKIAGGVNWKGRGYPSPGTVTVSAEDRPQSGK